MGVEMESTRIGRQNGGINGDGSKYNGAFQGGLEEL